MYELFGTNKVNALEFLGAFHNEEAGLKALDSYWGIGYSKLKLGKWTIR